MNNEWKMPEWMIKWVHVIDKTSSNVDKVEQAMNSPWYNNTCTEECIKAKVELMETLHKKGLI